MPGRDDFPARGNDARTDAAGWDVQAGAAGGASGGATADELRRHREAVAERLRRSSTWPRELEGRVHELEARIDRVLEERNEDDGRSGSGLP